MLRISKLTDYGVVLSTHLAGLTKPKSVRELASETGLPEPTVGKVLKTLSKAGVVTSRRGANGGYSLSRSADAISIVEVISALEGPIAVTECTDESDDASCAHETHCAVRGNWQRINDAVLGALGSITLDEMARSASSLVTLSLSRDHAQQQREA